MVRTKNTLGAKATKMLDYINHIIRVELIDGRSFIGQFLAYDVHMNLVLSKAKEVVTKGIRKDLPPLPNLPGEDITVEKQRGLVIIRGVEIISVHICGPPPCKPDDEIPKQFPLANWAKWQTDSQLGLVSGPPPMLTMMAQGGPGMMAPGMMPRPGMMPPPGAMPQGAPGMMPQGAPGTMPQGAPGTMPQGAPGMAPPAGMMPRPVMMPPPGMMPPGGMMPRPGMMPPPGMMPRPGMIPPPGMMPRPGMMPPAGMMPRPGMMPPPGGAPNPEGNKS